MQEIFELGEATMGAFNAQIRRGSFDKYPKNTVVIILVAQYC